jgi:hypothetical protein
METYSLNVETEFDLSEYNSLDDLAEIADSLHADSYIFGKSASE